MKHSKSDTPYIPSGFDTYQDIENMSSFTQSIEQANLYIKNASQHHHNLSLEDKLRLNAPFELKPKIANANNQHLILLIHGLSDTAACMTSLAYALSIKGFRVRSLLLPGHAGRPADLLGIKYQTWACYLEKMITLAPPNIVQTSLIGFSTGAILSVYACQNPLIQKKIHKLVLVAPAFKLKTVFKHILPIATNLKPWLYKKEECDPKKYQSLPAFAANEVYKLGLHATNLLKKSHVPPIFMILTMQDETICSAFALKLLKSINRAEDRGIVYLPMKQDFERKGNILYKNSYYPENDIINFAHVSLINGRNSPHFGQSHFQGDTKKGALTLIHLLKYTSFERLTYNPDFENLVDHITSYLESPKSDDGGVGS